MNKLIQDNWRDLGLFIFRVSVGAMMLFGHGWGKLNNLMEGASSFPDPLGVGPTLSLGLAVFAEFFCSVLVAFGLFTRAAAVPLIVTMAVAALIIHGADPWADKEMAVLYGVSFLLIFLAGPGRLSLDSLIGVWRNK